MLPTPYLKELYMVFILDFVLDYFVLMFNFPLIKFLIGFLVVVVLFNICYSWLR